MPVALNDLLAYLLLMGEVSEPKVHMAREQPIHFAAAGHHATERLVCRRWANTRRAARFAP